MLGWFQKILPPEARRLDLVEHHSLIPVAGAQDRTSLLKDKLDLESEYREMPVWGIVSCRAAMRLGTLFAGWRIVHSIDSMMTRRTPQQGFCAETGSTLSLLSAILLGVPVSTTHKTTDALLGVGAERRISAVSWSFARGIVTAWMITRPMAGLIASGAYLLSGSFLVRT